MQTFAHAYNNLLYNIRLHPVDIQCRGRQMAFEFENVRLEIPCRSGVAVYSHAQTRAFPIKFALAELAWMLAMRDDVASIARFNKNIVHYSDDKVIMGGAYGKRLGNQITNMIQRMIEDKHTRQACATIWREHDSFASSKDHPCNVFLQFMIRDNRITLTVTSRSSDLITGLPIDVFHWQFLLHIVRNELLSTYPGLSVGGVLYNLTSLHVYDTDRTALESMAFELSLIADTSMYHVIEIDTSMKYSKLVYKCQQVFDICESIGDLADMFGFEGPAATKLGSLHDTFINRVHKFERKGDKA